MNFEELQQAEKKYDELMIIGKTIEKRGRIYHIAGMTRRKKEAVLYVLERDDSWEARREQQERDEICEKNNSQKKHTNRMNRKICFHQDSYFFEIGEFRIENHIYPVRTASSGCLGVNNYEMLLLFSDMLRAGWNAKDSPFELDDWDALMLTEVVLELEQDRLPAWQGDIFVKLHRGHKTYLVEQPVRLTVGKECETEFILEDGRKGICYINKVSPVDIWKEQEEQFQNPKYLERVSKERLEEMKHTFFSSLEQNCPRGMCYLGVEYECSIEGNIVFYDSAFLDAEPKVYTGSVSSLMMLLKPDEPVGKHGYSNHGCMIQTAVFPDVKELLAELFEFVESFPEKEELL